MRVAKRWFDRRGMNNGITLLWEPHVHPLIQTNIWYVHGRDRDLLIDAGNGLRSLRQEIVDLMDKPLLAVATHIHFDHVGSFHEFDTRVVHEAEAPAMKNYSEFTTLLKKDLPDELIQGIALSGYPIEGDYLIEALPEEGYDPEAYRITPAEATQTVRDGDRIDLGDRSFEVIHLPGHSPGSIGLWEEQTGILFSGDAVYDGALIDTMPDSDINAYIASMKRLADLPVSLVHAGHDASFGPMRLKEIVDDYLALRDI